MASKKQYDNHVKAYLFAQQLAREIQESAGQGLNAARIFLAARVKETLSEPAPRKRVTPPGGVPYYRATTPATVGAPPRKLSGKLRQSVTSAMVSEKVAVVGTNVKSDKEFDYAAYHEGTLPSTVNGGKHPFLLPTAEKYWDALMTIIGNQVTK